MHRIHRLSAVFVFTYALVLYGTTMAPTTSFWDSGEFIASVHGLEVMHPPGAPVYMLIGRLFSMFAPPPFVAPSVNLVSVLASALTVLLGYLILVRLILAWRDPRRGTRTHRIIAISGGIIGALAFAASDSFWYNAVEAEVYALSMFFTALPLWLILRWQDRAAADQANGLAPFTGPGSRLLILIAYLYGLATGIHLMALLTFFFIALIIYFQYFEPEGAEKRRYVRSLLAAGLVTAVAFLVIYPGIVVFLPDLAGWSGRPGLFAIGVCLVLVLGLIYTERRGQPVRNLIVLCLIAVLIGYSSYALIPIRSLADPPIDLNDPETTEALVPYIKRDQYGQTPLLHGATYDNRLRTIDYDHPALFPRRHSEMPRHLALYAGYRSDLDYFVRYQLGHMYVRYLLWNFAGRAQDTQHARSIFGFSEAETADYVYLTPSERASRNAYFGLPLLLGLLGMAFHFNRDPRRALCLFLLFLATGFGLVVYLNEVPVTPRERDYIFVASFFAFSLWIGMGAAGLLGWVQQFTEKASERLRAAATGGTGLVLLAAVPLLMVVQNYDDHDRSGRMLARDFAYNLLMSVEDNAVLFVGGDNDTYPLWYLQEVEGIRRDVRVVTLSLLDTGWYALQLKHQWSREAPPLPITMPDDELAAIQLRAWKPREIALPVNRAVVQRAFGLVGVDTTVFESPMRWTLNGRPYNQELSLLYPSDQVILNMLAENARQGWPRPFYFAATSGPDSQLDLQPYFQREGLAYRIVPLRHENPFGRVVPEIMMDRLSHFRFTNLADPAVYYHADTREMVGTHYRQSYLLTADELTAEGPRAEARNLLDRVMRAVPPETIPPGFYTAVPLAQAYLALGDSARAVTLTQAVEPRVLQTLRAALDTPSQNQAIQQIQTVQVAYLQAGAFDEAARLGNTMADLLQNDAYRQTPEALRQLIEDRSP